MMEFELEKNRTLIFENEHCLITRDDALTERNKQTFIKYDEIKSVIIHSRKINWINTVVNFILMTVLQTPDNPVYGKNASLEILFNNGEKRLINIESTKKEIIIRITQEFHKRINKNTSH